MSNKGEHPTTNDGERSSASCPPVGAQKTTTDDDSGDHVGEQDPPTSSRLSRGCLEPAASITASGCAKPPPAVITVLSDETENLLWHWGLRVNYEL